MREKTASQWNHISSDLDFYYYFVVIGIITFLWENTAPESGSILVVMAESRKIDESTTISPFVLCILYYFVLCILFFCILYFVLLYRLYRYRLKDQYLQFELCCLQESEQSLHWDGSLLHYHAIWVTALQLLSLR